MSFFKLVGQVVLGCQLTLIITTTSIIDVHQMACVL